jgi:hypothetical protein
MTNSREMMKLVEMKKMEVRDKNHLYHYLAGAAVNYV